VNQVDEAERSALRDLARSLAEEHATSAAVRTVSAELGTPSRALDAALARAGLFGLEIPEEYGGSGASFAELVAVLEELGGKVAPSRLTATAALCTGAILLAGSDEQHSRWLPALADGSVTGTATFGAFSSPGSDPLLTRDGDSAVWVDRATDGWTLHGTASYVLDARVSDLIVVSAASLDGPVVAVISGATEGLSSEPIELTDGTRCLDTVKFVAVPVLDSDVLAVSAAADDLIEALTDRVVVAVAADSVGAAQRLLDVTVTYASQREQFGRPIGGFQAVKHHAANMLVNVETSSALLDGAARAVTDAPWSASGLASMAKEYCCERAAATAGTALQVHGGIGYTWEHDLHLYLKRVLLNQYLFGDVRYHRRRIARRLVEV
jgi:alkylation response protein AidB-like acyl-CoA dehydrogenase